MPSRDSDTRLTLNKTDPELQRRRNHIWKHNSFLGCCTMMQRQLEGIATSASASPWAKALASSMLQNAKALEEDLRNVRIDHVE